MLIALALVMALQTTSFGIIMPLFPLRLAEIGAGVDVLSLSILAFAVAGTLSAPLMGALADRYGRRPLVLGPALVYVLAFTGYGLAPTAAIFVALRGLAGGLTAGLMPAITGIVADLAPERRRAQWIGVLSGGMAVGWMVGPALGGALNDRWGLSAAFGTAVGLAVITLLAALLLVPETLPAASRARGVAGLPLKRAAWRGALPQPTPVFVLLLGVALMTMLAWAFVDPQLGFYAYDELGWSSSQLGLVFSAFGVSNTLGVLTLGHLSDRLGRKPVLAAGMALYAAQFLGLTLSTSAGPIMAGVVMGGLGGALVEPALAAALLDITPPDRKARVLGLKATATSLGNILGPLLVILATPAIPPRGAFAISAGLSLLTAAAVLVGMRPGRPRLQA